MATASGIPDPDLKGDAIEELLRSEPHRFAFFQAVRLLERFRGDATPVGGYGSPAQECVRFRAHPSTAFPASEVQSLEFRTGLPAEMTVNFMGLTGPLGVLPQHYTELLRERIRLRDTALRDFLDIFNHRLVSLFYLAWEKYRPVASFERQEGEDVFRECLYGVLGLGTQGLRRRQQIPDEMLLFNGGMLSMHTRPAVVLRDVLEGYFGVPVEVEQFVGAWRRLDDEALCSLGQDGFSDSLGVGAVVGDEIWDGQSGVRVKLGPLRLAEYEAFMPGGAAHEQLHAWLDYFAGLEFHIELELILRREDVPACELGASESEGPRLGWTTWMKSAPFQRDPSDVVFTLGESEQ